MGGEEEKGDREREREREHRERERAILGLALARGENFSEKPHKKYTHYFVDYFRKGHSKNAKISTHQMY